MILFFRQNKTPIHICNNVFFFQIASKYFIILKFLIYTKNICNARTKPPMREEDT